MLGHHLEQPLSHSCALVGGGGREAAILAIGAVSSCVVGLSSEMPQLYPYLLQVSRQAGNT